ncbi:polyprenyl synthetase family protein [Microbacteriaceae bacterium 4G12]
MDESGRLIELVQTRLGAFLTERDATLRRISPDLAPFLEFSADFLRGGKRFRAQFCYWGWRAAGGAPDGDSQAGLDAVVGVASGLELFHAAALVHDDIIDHSDTRRGGPAAHRRFEQLHRSGGWRGDPRSFGEASAVLFGDLLLGWSDELILDSLLSLPTLDAARASKREFDHMRTEVTAGQYLDVLEELAWPTVPETDALERAHRVITYKSAKYSIEAPLAIGASMAGTSAQQVQGLRDFGLPLGIAYQLRDDLLGVFGDAAVTGKPSGDDLREGKRTVLVALTRANVDADDRDRIDAMLGDPGLTEDQIRFLQDTVRSSGAVDATERLIEQNVAAALSALAAAPLEATAAERLAELADTVTRRTA